MATDLRIGGPITDQAISFTFDGVEMTGFVGDTIVAALFANGIRVFRTMPKSGHPRGGFCFAGRCSDCQVIVDGSPGTMACVTALEAGMTIETQHGVGEWGDQ